MHPSAELYGSDRVALESAAALVEAGWDVVVALASPGPLRAELEAAGAGVVILGAPVLRKSLMSPRGLAGFAVATARALRPMWRLLRRHRPDVVYVSTVTVPTWLPLARLSGARVLCHVHEAEEALPRAVRVGLAAPLLFAHAVVANSQVSRDVVVRDVPRLRRRTTVIYNGVPGPAGPVPPREVLTGPVRLVLVGRVSPRKGTDVAVEALAGLRRQGVEAELTLVGGVFPGYEWFETEVRELAEARGVADRVHWAGVRPSVWESLAEADVALVPSRVEPFGNAAVEALLAGRPVVVGCTQGLREIVTEGVNGVLADPGDARSLADAVLRVVGDWPLALARAEAAGRDAVVRFSPARYRTEIVDVMEATAGRSRAGSPAGSSRAGSTR